MKQFLSLLTLICLVSYGASAAEGGATPPHQHWHWQGWYGTYDQAALQRGFLVYKQVCSTCHSMDQMHFRNLDGLGYNAEEIKAIASEFTVTDGPNDEGEMYERAARAADKFPAPFANVNAAKYANGGAYPPDLSLITMARHHGADYVYALLSKGYVKAPHDKHLLDGQYYNKYMAGNIIAMAPPLSDGLISYPDGTPETKEQYARDVAEFLQYAADPHMQTRKEIGIRVMIFLVIFSLVFFLAKKKLWKGVKGH